MPPVEPQPFDLVGEGNRNFPPPMPVPQPSMSLRTRKRRALIVRGRKTRPHMLILISVKDWDQLRFPSKYRLSITVLRRRCVCNGKLSLRCCNSLRNIIFSLIHPLANLGFAREHITIMTDESQPWNLPTKGNIVGPTCGVLPLFSPLHFVS